jgi:hypothetical protein
VTEFTQASSEQQVLVRSPCLELTHDSVQYRLAGTVA